jgi:hypothetical protein
MTPFSSSGYCMRTIIMPRIYDWLSLKVRTLWSVVNERFEVSPFVQNIILILSFSLSLSCGIILQKSKSVDVRALRQFLEVSFRRRLCEQLSLPATGESRPKS